MCSCLKLSRCRPSLSAAAVQGPGLPMFDVDKMLSAQNASGDALSSANHSSDSYIDNSQPNDSHKTQVTARPSECCAEPAEKLLLPERVAILPL